MKAAKLCQVLLSFLLSHVELSRTHAFMSRRPYRARFMKSLTKNSSCQESKGKSVNDIQNKFIQSDVKHIVRSTITIVTTIHTIFGKAAKARGQVSHVSGAFSPDTRCPLLQTLVTLGVTWCQRLMKFSSHFLELIGVALHPSLRWRPSETPPERLDKLVKVFWTASFGLSSSFTMDRP